MGKLEKARFEDWLVTSPAQFRRQLTSQGEQGQEPFRKIFMKKVDKRQEQIQTGSEGAGTHAISG